MSSHDLIVDTELINKNDKNYAIFMQKIKQLKLEYNINIRVYKNTAYHMKFTKYPVLLSHGSQYYGFIDIIKYLIQLSNPSKVEVMPKNYDAYLFKNIMNGKKFEEEELFGEGLNGDKIKSLTDNEMSRRKSAPANTKKYASHDEMDDDIGAQMKIRDSKYNLKSGDFDLDVWSRSIDKARKNTEIDDEDISAMNNLFRGVGTTKSNNGKSNDVKSMFS